MSTSFHHHMKAQVQSMRDELTALGIKELVTAESVQQHFDAEKGTMLVVINSVCGCAAGQCRPGVAKALEHEVVPDHLYTVFAGQDKEATAEARKYFAPHPPSSPSIVLMKEGQVVHFIKREGIEGRTAEQISGELTAAFDRHCR